MKSLVIAPNSQATILWTNFEMKTGVEVIVMVMEHMWPAMLQVLNMAWLRRRPSTAYVYWIAEVEGHGV